MGHDPYFAGADGKAGGGSSGKAPRRRGFGSKAACLIVLGALFGAVFAVSCQIRGPNDTTAGVIGALLGSRFGWFVHRYDLGLLFVSLGISSTLFGLASPSIDGDPRFMGFGLFFMVFLPFAFNRWVARNPAPSQGHRGPLP